MTQLLLPLLSVPSRARSPFLLFAQYIVLCFTLPARPDRKSSTLVGSMTGHTIPTPHCSPHAEVRCARSLPLVTCPQSPRSLTGMVGMEEGGRPLARSIKKGRNWWSTVEAPRSLVTRQLTSTHSDNKVLRQACLYSLVFTVHYSPSIYTSLPNQM